MQEAPNNLTARQFNCIKFDSTNAMKQLSEVSMVAGGRIELPTRGFSERQAFDSYYIYQLVTGASVANLASLCMTMHNQTRKTPARESRRTSNRQNCLFRQSQSHIEASQPVS